MDWIFECMYGVVCIIWVRIDLLSTNEWIIFAVLKFVMDDLIGILNNYFWKFFCAIQSISYFYIFEFKLFGFFVFDSSL